MLPSAAWRKVIQHTSRVCFVRRAIRPEIRVMGFLFTWLQHLNRRLISMQSTMRVCA